MKLHELPPELLVSVCAAVEALGLRHLRELRCVSKTVSEACSRRLFRTLNVVPTERSLERYRRVHESPRLNVLVTKVIFNTSLVPNEDIDSVAFDGPIGDLPESTLEAMELVAGFPMLKSAELKFQKIVAAVDSPQAGDVPEDLEMREEVLQKFYECLNTAGNPLLNHIGIKYLQDLPFEAVTQSPDFQAVMSRITKLSLYISTEYDEEESIDKAELHSFFSTHLARLWLNPIAHNLTYLKLYADTYWGYIPRCELPHFPRLKKLALGKWSITHDKQLKWILAHAPTLEELTLDDCPIVHCTLLHGPRDADNYPLSTAISAQGGARNMWQYERRWWQVLDLFRSGLGRLRRFGCGEGPWECFREWEDSDLLAPDVPWKGYVVFDGGSMPSQWVEPNPMGEYEDVYQEEAFRPECEGEDMEALERLMAVVRKRGR